MQPYTFWRALAGPGPKQYNDIMRQVLVFNGYNTGSSAVQDMYAAWRREGFPVLAPLN